MWTKESYQEHMLGYLYGVETQIEALEQSPSEIRLLYRILDRALDRLWRLIMASDTEWEWFRFALEVSCDDLLDACIVSHKVLSNRNLLASVAGRSLCIRALNYRQAAQACLNP